MATRKNRGSRRGRGTRKGGSWRMSNGKWKKNTPELKSIHAEMKEIAPMGQFTRNSATSSPKLHSIHAELQTMEPMGQFTRKSASLKSLSRKSSSKIPVGTRRNGYYRGLANNWVRSVSYKKHRDYS